MRSVCTAALDPNACPPPRRASSSERPVDARVVPAVHALVPRAANGVLVDRKADGMVSGCQSTTCTMKTVVTVRTTVIRPGFRYPSSLNLLACLVVSLTMSLLLLHTEMEESSTPQSEEEKTLVQEA